MKQLKDTSPHSTSMTTHHGLNKNKNQLKKDLVRIVITILTSFFVYMLVMSLISIRGIRGIRFMYGDVTDEYLLIAYSQFSCIIACFLDEVAALHLIYSKKNENITKKSKIYLLLIIIVRICVSIFIIYYIKDNVLIGRPLLPVAFFIQSGVSLMFFLIEYLLPLKKKDTEVETK